MQKRGLRRLRLAACIAAALIALPAFADIAAFNAAVKAGDFKKAAVEAAATWPTLDKSRDDIALIAREFGFAAYVAGDYAAAQTFAQAAVAKETGDATATSDLVASTILLNLAAHRIKPSGDTRNNLFRSLGERAAKPGMDNISYLGADSVVAFDFEKGHWKDAQTSSHLAAGLAERGGPAFLLNLRRFELLAGIADYMVTKKPEVYDDFEKLQDAILGDMQAAPDEVAAKRFVPLYWEVSAWSESLYSHLVALNKKKPRENTDKAKAEAKVEQDRIKAAYPKALPLIHKDDDDEVCKPALMVKEKPKYPESALYGGLVGTVILQVDIDKTGMLSNPKILAAVPEKDFGKSVLASFRNITYKPGEPWEASTCSLEEKGHVMTFNFQIQVR